jgi:hypothetical protein
MFVVVFLVSTPIWLTSGGSDGLAVSTLFCTSMAPIAWS